MKLKLGVDGGGTKTEVIALNPQGEILARQIGPGCNPSIIGREEAEKTVRELLAQTLAAAHRAAGAREETLPALALLCMAGNREFWRDLAGRLQADGITRVEATDDSAPVLELATRGLPGLVLHAGTGSFVAARDAEGTHFAGGLGWRLGDEGSGYDLGKRAAARTLLELQGWEPPSRLGAAVQKTLVKDGRSQDVRMKEAELQTHQHPRRPAPTPDSFHPDSSHPFSAATFSRRIYESPTANADLAALAPLVTQLADVNEPVALEIFTNSLTALAAVATRVHQKLFGPGATVACGLSGPLLRGTTAQRILRHALPECLTAQVVTDAPIEGVRRMLMRYE